MEEMTEDELRQHIKRHDARTRWLWLAIVVLSIMLAYLLYLKFTSFH